MKLTEIEKNEMVEEHKGIVLSVAHRLHFFDDFDDVAGWGYVGLTKAINQYEEDREVPFPVLAFPKVKAEIFNQYRRVFDTQKNSSIEATVFTGKDGSEKSLGEYLAGPDPVHYGESDIYEMFKMALFEELEIHRNITIDYYLHDRQLDEIAEEYNVSKRNVTKIHRRGKALVKRYLVNNGTIVDYVDEPADQRERTAYTYEELSADDYGKLKYLRRYFPQLSYNDVASLMQVSSFEVMQILDYPTTTYISAPYDKALKEAANSYMQMKYSHMLPSEVEVYAMV